MTKGKLDRFVEGVKEGQRLAEAGEPFPEKYNNKSTAYASGLRTAYSKRRQRLNTGPKEVQLTERFGKKRIRNNSVLVKYDSGDTYHITNVTNVEDAPESIFVAAKLKDGTIVRHYIPLHNKDAVVYYGPKPKPVLHVVHGSDPEFYIERRKK